MTAPLTGMTGPEATAAEQSRMELQARLNGLGGLNGRQLAPEAKAKKLREACEGFESIFIQKMWQEMRNAVPKTGLLTGREERFWQDMYDQELSKSMTKAGGIGLADMMYEQLSRNLVSASRSAAGVAQGAAFTPTAASLLGTSNEGADLLPDAAGSAASIGTAASIYDGVADAVAQPAAAQAAAPVQPAPAQPAAPAPAEPAVAGAAAPIAQPVVAPQPIAPQTVAAQTEAGQKKERRHIHKADLNQASGLMMAQKARRDAGDKLGSRAVRPSQRPHRQEAEIPVQAAAAQGVQQGEFKPGSPEALKVAMERAKSGAVVENPGQPLNLNNLVANVQAMNTAQQFNNAQAEAVGAEAGQPAEPVTRKVRFSTNVPKQAQTGKKTKQAIRMLNVDNTGVNSQQGKGLAAYHAQQEAARAVQPEAAQPVAPLKPETVAQAPIPPLTPQSQPVGGDDGNFAIPPLTAADSRS